MAIIEAPISIPLGEKDNAQALDELDSLALAPHALALSDFIVDASTPFTIGIQGEWGSGKTSLMNSIRHLIDTRRLTRSKVPGREVFHSVWVNTWEHSILRSPPEILLSILQEIIGEIADADSDITTSQKARAALTTFGKSALRVGAAAALGSKAGAVADELLADTDEASVKKLRATLVTTIEKVRSRDSQRIDKFVVYVDDLDRLDPKVAVQVLELLKNIFNVEHCVFVLAIDYQVVVKGLAHKFGDRTEENEWEYRAFFDKIIQLPFMMPMRSYDLRNYLENLLKTAGYFGKADSSRSKQVMDYLVYLVRVTLGYNPRSLKRLANSLSLIIRHRDFQKDHDKEVAALNKQLIFSLVCLQIGFPKIYELLLINPYFYEWDDEFITIATRGAYTDSEEIDSALQHVMEIYPEDFDEQWEQVLFKVNYSMGWQKKSRLSDASRVLSFIQNNILDVFEKRTSPEAAKLILEQTLELTAVTSVASTDIALPSKPPEIENDKDAEDRMMYWDRFAQNLHGSSGSMGAIAPVKNNRLGYLRTKSSRVTDLHLTFRLGRIFYVLEKKYPSTYKANQAFERLTERQDELRQSLEVDFTVKIDKKAGKVRLEFEVPETWIGKLRGGGCNLTLPENAGTVDRLVTWIFRNGDTTEDLFSG